MSKSFCYTIAMTAISAALACVSPAAADTLDDIKAAYESNPDLTNLLLDPYFKKQMQAGEAAWRRIVAKAVVAGLPVPAMSSAPSGEAPLGYDPTGAAWECPSSSSRHPGSTAPWLSLPGSATWPQGKLLPSLPLAARSHSASVGSLPPAQAQ